MEKVILTKEQAARIEDFKKDIHYTTFDKFLKSHFDGWTALGNLCLNELSAEHLAKAWLIGYEVIQTPEEKVRDYYYSFANSPEGQEIIRKTVDKFDIKIKGVNT